MKKLIKKVLAFITCSILLIVCLLPSFALAQITPKEANQSELLTAASVEGDVYPEIIPGPTVAPEPAKIVYGPYNDIDQNQKHAYEPFKNLNGDSTDRSQSGNFQKDQVLIKMDISTPKMQAQASANPFEALGVVSMEPVFKAPQSMTAQAVGASSSGPKYKWYRAQLQSGTDVLETVDALEDATNVLAAEPNYIRAVESGEIPDGTLDDRMNEQWYLERTGVKQAWAYLQGQGVNPGGSRDVVVAVIDTGVDYNHPDLIGSMWINTGETPGDGFDNDSNGYIDDYYGACTVGNMYAGESGNPMDDHGHGTHVAGIIAAQANNGSGGVGIAYNVQVMAIKAAQSSGILTAADIAQAIDYARIMGADVINMSFGGYSRSIVEEDALQAAFGTSVLVAAAGNDGIPNVPYPIIGKDMFPAAYPWVLGVMAESQTPASNGDNLAGFSNWDYIAQDSHEYEVMAPGASILSTLPGGKYAKWSGTSMATPVVAGTAALLRSKFSDKDSYSSRFIMGQIASTGELKKGKTFKDPYTGQTKVNYYHEVNAFTALTDTPEPKLSYLEHYLFDTTAVAAENNADGVVDAGETIDIGMVIRNHWGKADNVLVTIDTKGSGGMDDPYITLLTDTVDFGAVGNFGTDDNGFIYENDVITGVNSPFKIKVADNTPNDHVIPINITLTCRNGFDPADDRVYSFTDKVSFQVRNGVKLPGVISSDMILTKDKYWIVPNATVIEAGATVTVEPGTQIQFWSSEPEDPYAEKTMAYIQVSGNFLVNGTAEEPVEMFAGALWPGYEVKVYSTIILDQYGNHGGYNGNGKINYAEIMNPNISIQQVDHCYFSQDLLELMYKRYLYEGAVRIEDYTGPNVLCESISNSIFYALGTNPGHYTSGLPWYMMLNIQGKSNNNIFDSCIYNFDEQQAESNVYLKNYKLFEQQYGDRQYWLSKGFNFGTTVDKGYIQNSILQNSAPMNFNDNGGTYFGLRPNTANLGVDEKELAEKFAVSLGGHLAVINDPEENDFITLNFSGFPYVVEIPGISYVTGISLDKPTLTLGAGGVGEKLSPIIRPLKAVNQSVIWKSSQSEIATVDENGVVTPLTIGNAVITATTSDGGFLASCEVTVIEIVTATGVSLNKDNIILPIDHTEKLLATVLPESATNRHLVWTSSNAAVASVDQNGLISPISEGTAVITVTSEDGGFNDECQVQVVVPVSGMTLDKDFLRLVKGTPSTLLTAAVLPVNASIKNVVWKSSNTAVATVDASGAVTPVGEGTALISATSVDGGYFDSCIVTVWTESVNFISRQVSAGDLHSLALDDSGMVWAWGHNYYGQLGDGTYINRDTPVKVPGLNNVISIDAGSNFSLALKNDGFVWAYGYGNNGQLGNGAQTYQQCNPVRVINLSGVTAIAAGGNHSLAVKSDGTVWAWGENGSGQLGDGTTSMRLSPVQVQNLTDVVAVAAGSSWSVALKSDGTVWCWGDNSYGRLGDGTNTNSIIPVQVSNLNNVSAISAGGTQTLALKNDGSVWAWGYGGNGQLGNGGSSNSNIPARVENLTGGIEISAGLNHSAALKSDGTVWIWGYNATGQLGNNTTTQVSTPVRITGVNAVSSLSAGGNHTLAVKEDGSIWAWGHNQYGQLGDFTATTRLEPVQTLFGILPDNAGPTVLNSSPANEETGVSPTSKIQINFDEAIRAGDSFGLIKVANGSGQTISLKSKTVDGNMLVIEALNPLAAGTYYSVDIPGNAVKDMFNNNRTTAYNFRFTTDVVQVTGVSLDQTALNLYTKDEPVQLQATVTPGNATNKKIIWSSSDPTVSLVSQDGLVSALNEGSATVTATTENGGKTALCLVTTHEFIPVTGITLNKNMMEMAVRDEESLSAVIVPIEATNAQVNWNSSDPTIATVNGQGKVTAVGSGTAVITASTADGGLSGSCSVVVATVPAASISLNKSTLTMQIGDSEALIKTILPIKTTNQGVVWSSNQPSIATVDQAGLVRVVGEGSATITITTVDGGFTADVLVHVIVQQTGLSLNNSFLNIVMGETAILQATVLPADATNKTVIWSSSNEAILQVDEIGNITPVSQGTAMVIAKTEVGNFSASCIVTVWNEPMEFVITKTAAGGSHTLALSTDGQVWAWGNNDSGQLGDGTNTQRATPVLVQNLDHVVNIAAGSRHSLAVKNDGTVWAWGNGDYGKLGNGSNANCNAPVQVNVLTGMVDVAAGENHSLSLKSDGTVWAWGKGGNGQLGNGSANDTYVPIKVSNLSGINKVVSGDYHSLALKNDGTLWSWGYNDHGQLGEGTTSLRKSPVQVQNLLNVVSIAVGYQHSMALTSDGSVWGWGYNDYRQLCTGDNIDRLLPYKVTEISNVNEISAGYYNSTVLRSDGTVWSWGYNNYGQLGDGSNNWGYNPVMVNLTGIAAISGGDNHSTAVKSDGTVWVWGLNSSSQLGDFTTVNRNSPVQTLFGILPDNTPPQVVSTSPVDYAEGVSPDALIKITFDEAVKAGSEFVYLNVNDAANNPISFAGKTISGNVLKLEPLNPLKENTVHTVEIPANSLTDMFNNPIMTEYSFTFRTQAGIGADITPPVITLNGTATINQVAGLPFTDPGAVAMDDVDGEITANIAVGGDPVDINTPGTYVITYNVSDAAGNPAVEVSRTVTVTESTPPDTGFGPNITADQTISNDASITGNLVIAEGATVTIDSGVSVNINGDLLLYGKLNNHGTLTISGTAYVNNYNNMLFGDPDILTGIFMNTGYANINEIKAGFYPDPPLDVDFPLNGDTLSSTDIQVQGTSYPGLIYQVNGLTGTVGSDGSFGQSCSLNTGENSIVVSVTDPFGNSSENTIIVSVDTNMVTVQSWIPDSIQLPQSAAQVAMIGVEEEVGTDLSELGYSTLSFSPDGRYILTQAEIDAARTALISNGELSAIRNNAILNRWWDPNVDHWMRFTSNEGDQYQRFLAQNYWGTTSDLLIGKALVDYNDFRNMEEIIYKPILTEAPETAYPFVTDVTVSTESEAEASRVGAENIEIHVDFNRDMDQDVQPQVSFGPDMPTTDYTVNAVNGGWISPRQWLGDAKITPLTGDGYQFFRVAGAVAADDPWLVTGNDSERFRFEIITSGTEAMNLQASGEEGKVALSWTQDDFDLLAGYNLYRCETSDGTFARINTSLIPAEQKAYDDTNVQPGKTYYYKFTVVKTDLTESDYSNLAAATPLDTIPPVIVHDPVQGAAPGLPLQIFADVTDNVAVRSVSLYFRRTGTTTYSSKEMSKGTGNRYAATMEGSLLQSPGLDYYIEATDGISTVKNGRPDNPNQVIITDAPKVTVVSPTSGSAGGGTEVIITGSNFKTGASVLFGQSVASGVVVESVNRIRAVSPAHFAAAVDIKVINTDGYSDTMLRAFTYQSTGVTISLPDVQANRGQLIEVPLTIGSVAGMRSADIKISFDPAVLSVNNVRLGNITSSFVLAENASTPGELILSLASSTGTTGSGVLAYIEFNTLSTEKTTSPLTLTSVSLNSGSILAETTNGSFSFDSLFGVSGSVGYYKDGKPVGGAKLTLAGTKSYANTSGVDGTYTITGIEAGDYLLQPAKSDDATDITAYDAALILQAAVGLTTLSDNQKAAADVDRNGSVNGLDASYVLEKAAGLLQLPFPGAGKTWDFVPSVKTLNGLNANHSGENFTAVLIGDVSGNWAGSTITGIQNFSTMESGPALTLGTTRLEPGQTGSVALTVDLGDANLYGADLVVSYNQSMASVTAVEKGDLTANFSLASNLNTPGEIHIALASAQAASGKGTLLNFSFLTVNDAGLSMPLEIEEGLVNEVRVTSIDQGKLLISIAGDTNLDNTVDLLDLVFTARNYGLINQDADLNSDGRIDLFDLVQVGRNLGRVFQ